MRTVFGNGVGSLISHMRSSTRRILVVGALAAPAVVAGAAQTGCGIDTQGLFDENPDNDAGGIDSTVPEDAQSETDVIFPDSDAKPDADAADTSDAMDAALDSEVDGDADVKPDADASDAGKDADADAETDAGADADADAGPIATFSNDVDKNNCIHWLSADGGVTKAFKSDDHVCLPKPVDPMSIAAGYDVYVYSKDPANSHKIRFVTPISITSIYTKCSTYVTPPNKAEMEAELLGGGYIPTTNAAILPNVEVSNAGCPNSAAFVFHVAP